MHRCIVDFKYYRLSHSNKCDLVTFLLKTNKLHFNHTAFLNWI